MSDTASSSGPYAESGPAFADGKSDGAMRTIGEVCAAFDLKPHVLRYWESKFPMLRPLKRSGGRRLYRAEDVAMVEQIDRLVNREGYTLKGAKKALAAGGAGGAPAPAPATGVALTSAANAADIAPGMDRAELARQLRAIRDRLSAVLDA